MVYRSSATSTSELTECLADGGGVTQPVVGALSEGACRPAGSLRRTARSGRRGAAGDCNNTALT